jgi:hypothetical protein
MKAVVICVVGLIACAPARAEEFCNWRPKQIATPNDIRGTTLVIKTSHDTLGIYDKCVTIVRRQFGPTLFFQLVNRFPGLDGSGYALIKSTKLMSVAQKTKIALSRGKGWFLARGTPPAAAPARVMKYEPFYGTVEAWNAAHRDGMLPDQTANQLGVEFDAFANDDFSLPSSAPGSFWKIGENFDLIKGVVTNYLVRFDLNPTDTVKPIPFEVFLTQGLQRFDLEIISNIDALSGTYHFVVRN